MQQPLISRLRQRLTISEKARDLDGGRVFFEKIWVDPVHAAFQNLLGSFAAFFKRMIGFWWCIFLRDSIFVRNYIIVVDYLFRGLVYGFCGMVCVDRCVGRFVFGILKERFVRGGEKKIQAISSGTAASFIGRKAAIHSFTSWCGEISPS